jgi:putative transposase
LVEAARGPLSVVAEASVRDERLLAATVRRRGVRAPRPTEETPQHLCLEKGYYNRPTEELVEGRSYAPHVQRSGEAKLDEAGEKRFPARRWVVGRTLGGPSNGRATLVRYEK